MKLIARVINNGSKEIIERDYNTKKQFIEDLRGNGYKVSGVYTEKQYQEFLDFCDCAGKNCSSLSKAKLWVKMGLMDKSGNLK